MHNALPPTGINNPTSAHPRQFIAPIQSCRKANPAQNPWHVPTQGGVLHQQCNLKLPKPTQATHIPARGPNPEPLFAGTMRHIAAQTLLQVRAQALSQALSGKRGAARGAVLCRKSPVPKMPLCKRAPLHPVNVFRAKYDCTGRLPVGVKPGTLRALLAQELRLANVDQQLPPLAGYSANPKDPATPRHRRGPERGPHCSP